jgi:hypothetical protein
MRRLALLVLVPLGASLAFASCSSGGAPSGEATVKTSPARVVDGMHYVQLFNTVDPVLQHLRATGTLPPATELQNAAGSLHQFASQARGLSTEGNSGDTLNRLVAASSTLAHQLTLAAKGSPSSDATSGLNSAMAKFQSVAAVARRDVGLPALVTTQKPQPDTGP